MKTSISHLREHLFSTLEALLDEEKPMPLDRARTVAEVAQTIINSAKVEVEMVNATKRISAGNFIPLSDAKTGRGALPHEQ